MDETYIFIVPSSNEVANSLDSEEIVLVFWVARILDLSGLPFV